jgi:hypothetical protein
MINTHKISIGKPEGKKALEEHMCNGRILLKWPLK